MPAPLGNLHGRKTMVKLWNYIVDYLADVNKLFIRNCKGTKAKRGIEPLTYKYESYALPIKLFCLNYT